MIFTGNTDQSGGGIDFSQIIANAFTGAGAQTTGTTPFDTTTAAQLSGYLSTSNASDPPVFMGTVSAPQAHYGAMPHVDDYGKTGYVEVTPGRADNISSVSAAENLPATWDETQVLDAIDKMRTAGFSVSSYDDMMSVWKAMVSRASGAYVASNGENKMTPWDALSLYAQEYQSIGGGSGSGGGGSTSTQVSRSVSEIDQGQAWQTLQGTLSNLLGRDPSDDELRDFVHRMNHLAVRNPTVTRTTVHTDGNGHSSSSSHTNPGFTSADMAEEAYDQAQDDPDYGAYQAASTYYNAVLSALGPVGDVG